MAKREIQLDDKTVALLKEQRADFKRTFGRDPGPDDPVFWDRSRTDKPVPLNEQQMAELLALAEKMNS